MFSSTELVICVVSAGPPVYPDLSAMSLEDVDSVSEADRDTLAPLPPPAWNNQYPYPSSTFLPHNMSYIPPHAYASADSNSYVGSFVDGATPLPAPPSTAGGGGGGNGSAGSVHSASGRCWGVGDKGVGVDVVSVCIVGFLFVFCARIYVSVCILQSFLVINIFKHGTAL